ncbi:MAG: VWA-like domain-containing protein [Fibrobacter sp.]|nr:VWA-like domain-containing protein [Fibrobacter sp.]
MDIEKAIEGTVARLAFFSPFSFNLLFGMQRVQQESIETMGVRVKSGRITLVYNPKFYESLEENERTFVLVHEMMHVLLHHCTHRCSGDLARAYKENVAMDLAINSMLTSGSSEEQISMKIPVYKEDVGIRKKGEIIGLVPSQFGFPEGLSFEQYLALLDKKMPDSTVVFVTCGAPDGTSIQDIDPNCALGKITKQRIDPQHGNGFDEDTFVDDYVRNVVENIERNHGWGHLGGKAIEMVKKAQEQPLNWGDILRLRLGPFISYQKQLSRRRWNKHYGKPFLGSTTKSVEPVAVYADTSGSVGSADLSRFIVEIERIANYTGVYLWSFDTCVQDPDEFVLFNRRSIDSIEFKGRGGTYFSPVFEHAREKGVSQVVVLTDGCAEEISQEQVDGLEVIWVITKGGRKDGKPGTVIEIN